MNDFEQKLVLTIVDKLAIGVLIVVAVFFLNRLLESFRVKLAAQRELEMLREQTSLKHLQRQIEELYSPLLGLIQYGSVVNQVEFAKLRQDDDGYEASEIRRYFVEVYYLPLNTQMTGLIRTKIYLLDGEHLPESFQQFLKHAAQFECLHKLWTEMRVQSDDIQGIEYPKSFKQDVERTLDNLRAKYNRRIGPLNS